MIDYVFVSSNLINAIVYHDVLEVSEYFDMDHLFISVSMGLGELLDTWLNSLHKQNDFKDAILANAMVFLDEFAASTKFSDLDAIWNVIHKIMVFSANKVFKKKWFKGFDNVFTKESLRFHKLELLVSRIFKISHKERDVKKSYRATKLTESLRAKEANIKSAIDKRMESFEVNKSHTIRSVLEHPFRKVVLNHLVVDDELILELDLVKFKCKVVDDIFGNWHCQYQSLEYVFDKAFSDVMYLIEFDELFKVKHCNKAILNMFLVLLNSCLSSESESVLINICSIALIETAHKILSKILSNRISSACSTFNVLYENNFLVLKSTMTQSPIFAIDSVIKNALEKDQELWLVLQDMDCINRIIIDFGLTGGYYVHNGLDQEEVFSSLLWHIFYDSLLCEAGLSSFFAAGIFINDILINNDKTVAIPINSRGLSKPSLAKAYLDVHFFTNLVLRKTVSDKQFLYLVSVVFYSIVSYRMQFSFVPVNMCNKLDALIHKGLKLKSSLPFNFLSNTIHHPFFYVQSESKIASLVSFVNFGGVLGYLFTHRSHDLQVFFSVCICVSASNNFLTDMVCIFLDCNLSLGGFLASFFWFHGGILMFTVLGKSSFLKCLSFLYQYGIAFVNQLCNSHGAKRLDPHGPVFKWFKIFTMFLDGMVFSPAHPLVSSKISSLNILNSNNFASVCDCLFQVGSNSLSVYMDGFLKNLGSVGCKAGAATFFENINLGLDIGVSGLMFSTMIELQAIALVLECVPLSSSVHLFSDNQSALDACKSELGLVKDHLGIARNKHANVVANVTFLSDWCFSSCLNECFIVADGGVISGNSRYFVHNVYYSICCAHWKVGSASVCTYFMKALHYWLPVAIRKQLYDKYYSSVLCLYYDNVEISDHVFFCELLLSCVSGSSVFMALYKNFVFNSWFCEAVSIFCNSKIASSEIVKFVHSLGLAFRNEVWVVHAKYHAYMEKTRLIPLNDSGFVLISGLPSRLSAGMVKLLGITKAFGIHFEFHKFCLFFSDINYLVSVYIAA
ncbi:hypothetical protein G9A89_012913 [Geosiphon pyriformis]|nr:hypothetical protein G9A89_012913 [Geosiphon pyriformis]